MAKVCRLFPLECCPPLPGSARLCRLCPALPAHPGSRWGVFQYNKPHPSSTRLIPLIPALPGIKWFGKIKLILALPVYAWLCPL